MHDIDVHDSRRRLGAALLVFAMACGGSGDGSTSAWNPEAEGSAGTDAGGPSGGGTADAGDDGIDDGGAQEGGTDGGASGTGEPPMQDLVEVGHEREFRGVWVTSVWNINFPSQTGLTASEMEQELVAILDTLEAYNLNAMVFQVRPESDALYASDLEPWSRFLTGSQGSDPGFDPLAFAIEEAHRRNIEVHAWLNPYRAKASTNSSAVQPHISLQYPEHSHTYGTQLWMDPGAEEVREHTVDVVLDIVDRYDVDGIHFDDYFYPYPNGDAFPDSSTRQAYLDGGGDLSLGDWRRENVHQLVEELHTQLEASDPTVRFGVSPFGIYRPGMPPGITGLDQYAEIYADPLVWMDEGWVDYLAPQLYWPTTQTAQAYEPLLEWWASMTSEGRYVFAGNNLVELGSSGSWSVQEFVDQVDISRTYRDLNSMGNIYFHIAPFETNQSEIGTILAETFYQQPVLTPPVAALADREVAPPWVELDGNIATLTPGDDEAVRAWVVYEEIDGAFELSQIVPASFSELELASGTWAISAADRANVESLGVRLSVR